MKKPMPKFLKKEEKDPKKGKVPPKKMPKKRLLAIEVELKKLRRSLSSINKTVEKLAGLVDEIERDHK